VDGGSPKPLFMYVDTVCFKQGSHHTYGHVRCVFTVLTNPMYVYANPMYVYVCVFKAAQVENHRTLS
jgi:hypothetical protein